MSETVQPPLHEAPAVRAETDPKFYVRFKWLGPAILAFAAWHAYDGLIVYPDQNVRSTAFYEFAEPTISAEELHEANPKAHGPGDHYLTMVDHVMEDEKLKAEWEEIAEGNGWPAKPFEKLRTEGDIWYNHVMAILAGIGGVWMLTLVFLSWGRWIEFNESGVASSWGESFEPSQVEAIDKKKWGDKGIAYVRYQDQGGGKKSFVVDDYKYLRKPTREILRRIELGAGIGKIVNGKPEPAPEPVEQPEPNRAPAGV